MIDDVCIDDDDDEIRITAYTVDEGYPHPPSLTMCQIHPYVTTTRNKAIHGPSLTTTGNAAIHGPPLTTIRGSQGYPKQ